MLIASLGTVAEVRADPAVERLVAADLPYGAVPVPTGDPVAVLTMVPAPGGGWDVGRDGQILLAGGATDVALATLHSGLQVLFAELADGLIFVHAGAVAVDGRAVVLPGRSLAGKSTLTAALVEAGAAYLSDEYAVFDDHGLVHPFPRPLQLRSPHGPRSVAPELLGRVETAAVPLGLVARLPHVDGARFEAAPCTPGQALLDLVDNAVAARSRTPEVLASLTAAARGKPGLRGRRGEAAEAARALLAWPLT